MKRKNPQLRLDLRIYRVGVSGWPVMQVQAPTPAAAKWRIFKLGREAGYFVKFRDFLPRCVSVREERRRPHA